MQDRIPTYPGRVTLTPVAGQANTYDMVRADQPTQAGTPLNKATLLKDATAALFGLGPDIVPDDCFAYLGKYAQCWWKRRQVVRKVNPGEKKSVYLNTYVSPSNSVQYSKEIELSTDGTVSLKNPSSYTVKEASDAYVEANEVLSGAYISGYITDGGGSSKDNEIVYCGDSASFTTKNTSMTWYTSGSAYKLSVSTEYGDWEYVQSSDRSAYPDSGEQDGYEYQYLGVPLENAVAVPKIETGSYVGTGTYGSSNPNSLTFGFAPKFFICISSRGKPCLSSQSDGTMWVYGFTYGGNYNTPTFSLSGNTLRWYSDTVGPQLNTEGETYFYAVIG